MKNISKILIPIDFSKNSIIALDWAKSLAKKYAAQLIVLHVAKMPNSMKDRADKHLDLNKKYIKRLRNEAIKKLKKEVPKLDDNAIDMIHEISLGQPFFEIIQVANKYEVDLIVMGTHGQTGFKHMLIGSVAERVVRKAPCPVLTVKNPDFRFEAPFDYYIHPIKKGPADGM